MLVSAILCEAPLRLLFSQRIIQPDMFFYYFQSYLDFELIIDHNDWKRIQMVSMTPTGQLQAYFEAKINRETLVVEDRVQLSSQFDISEIIESSGYLACVYSHGRANDESIHFDA